LVVQGRDREPARHVEEISNLSSHESEVMYRPWTGTGQHSKDFKIPGSSMILKILS
jgi:hypothetical protein